MDILPGIDGLYNSINLYSVLVMIFKSTIYDFGYFFTMKLEKFANPF